MLVLIAFAVAVVMFALACFDVPKTQAVGFVFLALGLLLERWR